MTSVKVTGLQGKDTDATATSTRSRVPPAPRPPLPSRLRLSLPGTGRSTRRRGAEGGRVRPGTRLLWRHVGQVEEFILTRSRASRVQPPRDSRGCRANQTHSTFKACEDTMTTPVPVAKTSHVTKPKVWGWGGAACCPKVGASAEATPSVTGDLSVHRRRSLCLVQKLSTHR